MSSQAFTDTIVRPVTAHEVESYRSQGWVHLPGLVDPTLVAELRSRAEALVYPESARSDRRAPRPGTLREAFELRARLSDQDPQFAALAHSPSMGRNACALLRGEPAVRLEGDTLLVKQPAGAHGSHAETKWHQDFAYSAIDRTAYVTIWVALGDISEEMGSLRFLNRSHQLGLLGRSWMGREDDLVRRNPWLAELETSRPLDLRSGDATAHSCLVVHGAGVNRSGTTRLAYALSYFDSGALYTGTPYMRTDGLGLEINRPLDHPSFPVVG